jgi:hypothetical protein
MRIGISCLLLLLSGIIAAAANIIASSATLSDVQSAVDAASDGDTVLIPNGRVNWTDGIVTTKQIIIKAQNYTSISQPPTNVHTAYSVVITNFSTSRHLITMTSGNNYHCGVGGIMFCPSNNSAQGGSASGIWGHVKLQGNGVKPPLLFACYFVANDRENVTAGEASFLSIQSLGAVIWNTVFDGHWMDGPVAGKGVGGAGIHITSPRAWATASTIGTLDTGGTNNVYFEDCRWYLWGQSDSDDNGRVVVRYSTIDGTGWQAHGFTSAFGGRHVEMYNNFLTNGVSGRNHSRYFWLRAGTALFTENTASDNNTGFGAPILFDSTHEGGGTYLVDRQIGCGHNGTAFVSDPVYIWNQTGPADYDWDTDSPSYFQLDRDIFVNSGAKPGYEKFEYPHPFTLSLLPAKVFHGRKHRAVR